MTKGKKRGVKPREVALATTPSVFIDGPAIVDMVMECKPKTLEGAYAFKWEYLEKEILSKYVDVSTVSDEDKAKAAIDKMLESEISCKSLNNNGYGSSSDQLPEVLYYAQAIVAEVLGEVPTNLYEASRFTGGASTSRKRKNGNAYFKYNCQHKIDVTRRLRAKAEALITSTPLWCAMGGYFNLNTTLGNKVDTVPKKTDIDRAIAIEPDMNMCIQVAIGDHIRGRLKVFGIDLNDQTRNQKLALHGSITDLVSTIDLSAASDSISCRLVWDLLPPVWFEELDSCRSSFGYMPDGSIIKWEKFSSMGNGFTFELESLLFYALTKANSLVMHQKATSYSLDEEDNFPFSLSISVYGDDIICPTAHADELVKVLNDVGFKTNIDKTFISGPFRESCGKHYYNGIDVSPFYVRKPIDNTSRVIWFLNKLRKWSYDERLEMGDPLLYGLWLKIRRKHVPPEFLGGHDIDNDSSVYSTDRPRNILVNKVNRREIGGYRAFLSKAQVWGRSLESNSIDLLVKHQRALPSSHNSHEYVNKASYTESDDRSFATYLCTTVEHTWLSKPYSGPDPDVFVSKKDYLYPQEYK